MANETATDIDFGPLSWVKPEIDHALQQALDALKAVVLQPADQAALQYSQTSLQHSQTYFHQAAGALQIVGLEGVTPYTDEIERQLGRLPEIEADEAQAAIPTIERAVRKLQSYLEELVNGIPAVPLRLFGEYQALQRLRGVDTSSPTDLFFPDLSQRPPKSDTVVHVPPDRIVSYLVRQRRQFQQGLLAWLRGQPKGADTMREAIQGIEDAQNLPGQRAFWWSAGGLLERLEAHQPEIRHAVKVLCARIDLQIRRLIEGSNKVADRLRREVLYYIALSTAQGKRIDAVRATYKLAALVPEVAVGVADTGQVQPVIRECRDLLAVAKDAWLKFTAGRSDSYATLQHSAHTLKTTADGLGAGPLQTLLGALDGMLNELPRPGSGKSINETLAMEYATGLLLADSALENFTRPSPEFPRQVNAMVQRLECAARDLPLPQDAAAIPLLDDMARRAQERLLLSNVVREIQVNLRHIEQVLDAFFRDHNKREELANLDSYTRQIQGALRILGLEKADELLSHCQAQISAYADPDQAILNDDLESLAESLSGFGFYIDAVGQQRVDTEVLIDRLLRKRLGIPEEQAPVEMDTVEEDLHEQREQLTPLLDAWQQQPEDQGVRAELKQHLQAVRQDAELIADSKLSEQTATALSLLEEITPDSAAALSETIQAIAEGKPGAAPAPPPSEETMRLLSASGDTLDAELLEIYLAEADEVLNTVGESLAACRSEPHNLEALRTIRRGFHTLKGSGRMVGLHELGELAWGVERRMNRWLEEERNAAPAMLGMIEVAQKSFRDWIGQLQTTGRVEADTSELETSLLAVDEAMGIQPPPSSPGPTAPPTGSTGPAHSFARDVLQAPPAAGGDSAMQASAVVEASPAVPSEEVVTEVPPRVTESEQPVPSAEISIGEVKLTPSLHGILTEEAQQHIATLRNELDTLLFDPYARPSDPMVRASHTLCGIHRTAGFAEVAATAYALEQSLLVLQYDTAPASGTVLHDLSEAVDVLATLVERIRAGQPFAAEDITAAEEVRDRLNALAGAEVDVEHTDSETLAAQQALAEEEIAIIEIEVLPPLEVEAQAQDEAPPVFEFQVATPDESPAEASEEVASDAGVEPELRAEVGEEATLDEVREPELHAEPFPAVAIEQDVPAEVFVEPTTDAANEELIQADFHAETTPVITDNEVTTAELYTEAAIEEAPPIEMSTASEFSPDTPAASAVAESSMPESSSEPERGPSTLSALATAATAAVAGLAAAAMPAAAETSQVGLIVSPFAEQDHAAAPREVKPVGAPGLEAILPTLPAVPAEVVITVAQDPLANIRDDVDDQLLPVFLEEAHELFPQAGEQLRNWRKSPDDPEAPKALQRTLHTFKGSARMAGVMRLGQLTHLMESRLLVGERPATPSPKLFEALDGDLDHVAFVLDRLQKGEFNVPLPEFATVQTEPVAEAGAADAIAPEVQTSAALAAVPAAPALTPAPTAELSALPRAEPAESAAPEPAQRALLRVRADVIDRLANEAGEISIARARVEGELRTLKGNLLELTNSVIRLRNQVREIEIQAESQIQSSLSLMQDQETAFDPLEFDRYTRFQELARSLTEGVNDVSTIQQALLKNLDDADTALLMQGRLNRDVQQELLSIRTVPFGSLSERLYRILRQTAKELDKKANLEIMGAQVELDRSVLEKLVGPLEHLLRNALDHGIERRHERLAANKQEIGEISLSVRQEGNEVVLTLADDGAGLDFARIRERAERLGLIPAGSDPTEAELIECTFAPGFTTATEVTQISGRGIGMDVVRNVIESLGGRTHVTSTREQGTTFTLYLPLTLAVAQAVLVRAGGRLYALPSPLVAQVQQVKAEGLINLYVARRVEWQGKSYPFFYLPRLLGDEQHHPDTLRYNSILLLRSGTQLAAVHVDQMIGNQEVVVKNIGAQLARVPGVTGATVLGSGEVVLIINPVQLVQRLEVLAQHPAQVAPPVVAEAVVEKAGVVMVVDDSLTVRKVTSRLLLREGYEVMTAKDGVDGLQALNEALPDIILLDIEMPRMDGFEFAKTLRGDPRCKHIPIIMITSRTAEKHRQHAQELGVEAYLGKPYQEEELLERIKTLIV